MMTKSYCAENAFDPDLNRLFFSAVMFILRVSYNGALKTPISPEQATKSLWKEIKLERSKLTKKYILLRIIYDAM